MRVLQVDAGRHMRGGQWQALYLTVGLRTIGVETTLMAPAGSPLLDEAARRGVPCQPLRWRTLRQLSAGHDLTHAHDAHSHTLAALLARGPVVVSRRVAFPIGTGWLSRWKYGRAVRYLAISRHAAGQLAAAGIPESKITVVYDGVPVDPKSGGLGTELLAPHWDDPRKAAAIATEAARLAGVPLRFSRDLAADLPKARALLYLSEAEGLGSAALLALSHGVPVIASRTGGLPEIVRHGETGLLVDNDSPQVAAAIRLLMQDAAHAARLGAAGREMVKDGFTLAHMALRTYHAYKEVLA